MPKQQIPVLKEARPKIPKTARKILFVLILLFAALLAVLFFRSPLSKVSQIDFTGNTFNSDKQLMQKAGLEVGAQFFGVDPERIESALAEVGTIKSAAVDKTFPGVIRVSITEHPTVAYELAADGGLKAILASGTSIPVSASGIAVEKPILTHWDEKDPIKVKLSEALVDIPNSMTSDISEIMPSPTPSFPDRIKMYTRSKFEVITAVSLLRSKVEYLNQVTEMQQPGIITMLEADSYEPFEPEPPPEEDNPPTTQE
ncbi:cell division protein FtsQ/DivIB [Paenibacillus lemnae]|uniref:FtsQ-type POTRA domain-containing protein n=1 Tax=Paenibacillus lemnae TaxID=1330551 RepID=A0A848M4Q4_PAELE|nr:FtsQ-type POTRA domain-containing protein [Paenibacillus lemnae]NMO94773.1 FtsQ-type POTRA domain-containing protein [Paenibacillus lemnae]